MDEIIQEMTRQIIYKEEAYPCGKKGRYLPPKRKKSPCWKWKALLRGKIPLLSVVSKWSQ
jgi:hypothetical protein